METVETPHWCSIHGGWHADKQYANNDGYCRTCRNRYQMWRFKQIKAGLPTSMEAFRQSHGLVKQPRPRKAVLLDCSACLRRPRERGAYCRGCSNAYIQWSSKRRALAKGSDKVLRNTIEEFQLAVDQGWVVPRHEGEPHSGKVIRQI